MAEIADGEVMGPVEFAVLEFPGDGLDGEIAGALADLVQRKVVAVIDLLIVNKGDDGGFEAVELADAGGEIAKSFEDVEGEVMWLLSDEDVAAAAEMLEPGTTGLLVVWENTWARALRRAVGESGGRLVVHDRLDGPAVAESIAETPEGR